MSYPPELLRHQLVGVGSSLLLTCVGVYSLVYGWRSEGYFTQGFIAFGVVSILVGVPMAYLATSWYRRAAQLVASSEGIPAMLTLVAERKFESTTLYAEVSFKKGRGREYARVPVLTLIREYEPTLGVSLPATLFVEAGSSLVKAISTESGMFWCIPHNIPLKAPSAN